MESCKLRLLNSLGHNDLFHFWSTEIVTTYNVSLLLGNVCPVLFNLRSSTFYFLFYLSPDPPVNTIIRKFH